MRIFVCSTAEPVIFAAQELCRILGEMGNPTPEIVSGARYDADIPGLYLGVFAEFPAIKPIIENPNRFDDEIYIETNGESGVITGSCERSVLIAAYRYLTELGCRFIMLGKVGEKIPQAAVAATAVSVHETPSYRHRGICIEGSVSIENVKEMIDFLPKVGMNSYFFQFRESHTFFDRWYSHLLNPELEKVGAFSIEQAQQAVASCAVEMSRRGILYHAVGHGWTCEPFGVPGLGWDKWTDPLPEAAKEAFALVNGKRGLWDYVPINTQACYSNPNVRKKILENVCDYVREHPTVDVLHFWLGDACGNHCECDECKKHRPSDFYVMMLNELDEMLTAQGLDARIVFLIYTDLLWPPVEFTIKNPDRFLVMFAPITRSYRKSFRAEGELPPITDFVRNAGFDALPLDVSLNVSYLKEWQKLFDGDGFDYDYHYMWAHIKEPGCIRLARILSEDIYNLKNLGLNGFISCQLGRVMFPNALNLVVMGRTLWKRDTDFDALCREYFNDCYADDAQEIFTYMSKLSDMYFALELERPLTKMPEFEDAPQMADLCLDIIEYICKFTAKYSSRASESVYLSWLIEHAWIYTEYTRILRYMYLGDKENAFEVFEQLKLKVFQREEKYQAVFDPWEFVKHTDQMLQDLFSAS